MPDLFPVMELTAALAIGLLIGLERGWKDREDPDGSRVAGFRTIGLIGLLGGLAMLLDGGKGFVLAASFLGLALLLREGFERQIDVTREVSVTTMVAALSAFTLGAIAVSGRPQLAAMGGVATTFILWLRVPFHGLLNRIEEKELNAFLHWLLISIVVLPVLPNEQFGPYLAINPRTIWLMVILISGLGFIGYLGIKWLGQDRGSLLMAVLGGLVSSTAATLAFARLARNSKSKNQGLVAGTSIAWIMMFLRTFVIVGLLSPPLLSWMIIPLGVMLLTSLLAAIILYKANDDDRPPYMTVSNPLDLKSAIFFALLLTGAMLLSKAASHSLGDVGLFAVSIAAGAVDIEAISLTMTQIQGPNISERAASTAIILAAISNTAFKGCLAAIAGRGTYGRQSLMLAGFIALTGGGALWLSLV